ncbi:hypothetical protein LZ838_18730, partial [Pseudomonas sp. AA27]|uniref:hypothetical protein n=1 Tax=Pseudomonas sp. AA27 TaxID=2908652 RepID=UPI001F3F04E0
MSRCRLLISAGYPRNPTERQNEKNRHKAGLSGVPEIVKAFYGTLNGVTKKVTKKGADLFNGISGLPQT